MIPKGTLLIIGGGEDMGDSFAPDIEIKSREFRHFEILESMLHGKNIIEIIITGSKMQPDGKRKYKNALSKIGFKNIGFIHIENKSDARLDKYVDRIEKASAVYFSGGDQFQVATILGGTPITDLIYKRYFEDKNFIVAGTSAGSHGNVCSYD